MKSLPLFALLALSPFLRAGDAPAPSGDAPVDALYFVKAGLPERTVAELVKDVGPAVVTVKGSKGLGSGFIINEEGYLVTNAHVVEGENSGDLTVTVYENGPHGLEKTDYPKILIIAYSGRNDLAVLKIDPKEPRKFTAVPIGDSVATQQGQKVFAFGSPLGLSRTTAEGNISVKAQGKEDGFYIQHTAPITHGNSGGPLFNLRGEVVGVNSQGAEGGGNIGFAIPSDVVKLILRNREAFAFDPSNPANGYRYLTPPASPAGAKNGVRLGKPLQMRLEPRSGLLRKADIDGDRRTDLVLANNAEGRIEIFYQRTPDELKKLAAKAAQSDREKPVLENAPFYRDSVTVSDDIHDILPMDFDGDGLVDLVYTGRRTGLNVIFQTAPGKWEKSSRYDKYGVFPHDGTLCAADVDGDGKQDLVALVQGGRALVFKGGAGKRDLGVPDAVGVANAAAQYLRVRDFDGDNKPDLLFVATGASGERNLSIRTQLKDGSFGPEHAITLGLAQPALADFGKGAGDFATIGEKTGELRLVHLGDREPSKDDRAELQPQIVRPPVSGTAGLLTVLADLTGSGRKDVVIADTEGSSLYAYARSADGRLGEDTAYPSLLAVSSLATLRLPGDKADRIVVCSAREKTAGLSEFKDGRLTFPAPLPLATEPFAAATIALGKDATRSVVCATRDGQRFNLEVLSWDDATKSWKSRIVKLGTMGRDPSGMLVRDINGDGREDILVFVPREPVRFIMQSADGSLEEAAKDDPVRKSQFDGINAENLGFGDFDGDGKEDILVARTGFVRAYSVSADNKIRLIDQANAKNPADNLGVPALVDTDGDGKPELVAYDAGSASLQVFPKKDGLHRYRSSIFLGKNEPMQILASGAGKDAALMIAGARQVWNIPLTGKQWIADATSIARSAVKDARFYRMTTANLTGAQDIAVIDGANDSIEIFAPGEKDALSSVTSFRVFSDERLVSRGGSDKKVEPSEIIGGDFDGDGLDDLAVLSQDRLLLYRQEK